MKAKRVNEIVLKLLPGEGEALVHEIESVLALDWHRNTGAPYPLVLLDLKELLVALDD